MKSINRKIFLEFLRTWQILTASDWVFRKFCWASKPPVNVLVPDPAPVDRQYLKFKMAATNKLQGGVDKVS